MTISSRRTPWKRVVLLCGKCTRKLDGGFGPKGKDDLKSTLRRAFRDAGHGREIRIIETRCLGICPKKAVTTISAGSPGTMFVVPAKTPVEEIMRTVLPDLDRQQPVDAERDDT